MQRLGVLYITCRSIHMDYIIYLSLYYTTFCQRLGFIIYHSAALQRDSPSLYIILPLYAETGLHYISFCRSMQRLDFFIYHFAALCRDWAALYIILSFCRSMQRLDFIIYHSVALCIDWTSLYIILTLHAETGLHYISF